jgi:hypothetical protein
MPSGFDVPKLVRATACTTVSMLLIRCVSSRVARFCVFVAGKLGDLGIDLSSDIRGFSVLGDTVNFGCERGAISNASYSAPPGFRLLNAHAETADASVQRVPVLTSCPRTTVPLRLRQTSLGGTSNGRGTVPAVGMDGSSYGGITYARIRLRSSMLPELPRSLLRLQLRPLLSFPGEGSYAESELRSCHSRKEIRTVVTVANIAPRSSVPRSRFGARETYKAYAAITMTDAMSDHLSV